MSVQRVVKNLKRRHKGILLTCVNNLALVDVIKSLEQSHKSCRHDWCTQLSLRVDCYKCINASP